MFSLKEAINNWRSDLVLTETLTPSNISELQEHLEQEVEHLQTSSLTEEESFLITTKKLGTSEQIST